MTKLQRRLIVAATAVVLFVGPLVIMVNCSGWNDGSVTVAACTVNAPLLRDLSSLLYGLVLTSALLAGIPILGYIVVSASVTWWVNRLLRNRARPLTRRALVVVMAVPAAIVAMALLEARAASGVKNTSLRFDELCRTAGEHLVATPTAPVDALYYDDLKLAAGNPGDLVEKGWLSFTEVRETDIGPGGPNGKYRRYALNQAREGQPADAIASAYGVYSKTLVDPLDGPSRIESTDLIVKALKSDETIATVRYVAMPKVHKYCGGERDVPFDVSAFLIRALALKRRLAAFQPDVKRARIREPGKVVHAGSGADARAWTLLAETADSLIYIDQTPYVDETATVGGNRSNRTVWELEALKTRDASGAISVRSRVEYSCQVPAFRFLTQSSFSEPMGAGNVIPVVRPPGFTQDGKPPAFMMAWLEVSSGTLSELVRGRVCAR